MTSITCVSPVLEASLDWKLLTNRITHAYAIESGAHAASAGVGSHGVCEGIGDHFGVSLQSVIRGLRHVNDIAGLQPHIGCPAGKHGYSIMSFNPEPFTERLCTV